MAHSLMAQSLRMAETVTGFAMAPLNLGTNGHFLAGRRQAPLYLCVGSSKSRIMLVCSTFNQDMIGSLEIFVCEEMVWLESLGTGTGPRVLRTQQSCPLMTAA